MSKGLESPVCGVSACEDMAAAAQDQPAGAATALMLDVVSDVICPWCWVGKRRLERAIASLSGEVAVRVVWRPFELNPAMPKGGLDRRQYRSAKFGSWARSLALDAQVAEVGASEGLVFRHDRIARTPNTFDAHRLIRWAVGEGRQDALVGALFAAYFRDGRDVGDVQVLAEIAGEAGLDAERAAALLASDESAAEVRAEIERFTALGVSGVPTVMANGCALFSGAIRTELMTGQLRRAAGGG